MTPKEYVFNAMSSAKQIGLAPFYWADDIYFRHFRKQVKIARYKGVFIGYEKDGFLFTSNGDRNMLSAEKLKKK